VDGRLLRPGGAVARLAEVAGIAWRPVDEEPVPVLRGDRARVLRRGEPFRVATWNLQFAGTRRRKFFYDGGDAVRVPEPDRHHGLTTIASEIRAMDADLLLLQELDRDSDRTGRVDQLGVLRGGTAYAAWAAASCHRCRFVPAPAREPLGRVDLHVALAARFDLGVGRRIQLPLLDEPRWRQAFNLKRCLLTAEIAVEGRDRPLHVAVTHLSAFSRGDGTLGRQVAVLRAWMEARARAGDAFVLGGDLNLLPPGDDPARLGVDAEEYADRPNPIDALIPRFRSVVPPARLLDPENATYLPWGAPRADRVLDYIFVSDDVEVLGAGPLQRLDPISDHHPVVATLRIE
jgi:endonuclease/exonuclease/phosphatase family metal-dependent hydrolase